MLFYQSPLPPPLPFTPARARATTQTSHAQRTHTAVIHVRRDDFRHALCLPGRGSSLPRRSFPSSLLQEATRHGRRASATVEAKRSIDDDDDDDGTRNRGASAVLLFPPQRHRLHNPRSARRRRPHAASLISPLRARRHGVHGMQQFQLQLSPWRRAVQTVKQRGALRRPSRG